MTKVAIITGGGMLQDTPDGQQTIANMENQQLVEWALL